MKVIVLICAVLSLAAAASAQVSIDDLKARAKKEKLKDLIIQYDKFKDKSLISTKPQNLIGFGESFAVGLADNLASSPHGSGRMTGHPTVLLMSVGIEFKGDRLEQDTDMLAVLFTSNSKGWVFLKGDTNLYILLDDERIEIAPVASGNDINLRSVTETLGFGISRTDLERILKAKKVEMKLGDTMPRKWKDDWSKRIRALLTLLNKPGAGSPA